MSEAAKELEESNPNTKIVAIDFLFSLIFRAFLPNSTYLEFRLNKVNTNPIDKYDVGNIRNPSAPKIIVYRKN
jgi:hypothetical protein